LINKIYTKGLKAKNNHLDDSKALINASEALQKGAKLTFWIGKLKITNLAGKGENYQVQFS